MAVAIGKTLAISSVTRTEHEQPALQRQIDATDRQIDLTLLAPRGPSPSGEGKTRSVRGEVGTV